MSELPHKTPTHPYLEEDEMTTNTRTELPADLSRLDVMHTLGISNATFYKLINSGRLKAYRITEGTLRVSHDELEDYRRRNEYVPKAKAKAA